MAEYEVILLKAAFSDLDEIFDYIMVENPPAAADMLENIMQSLDSVSSHPFAGPALPEHSLNRFHFRIAVISPYIAFYRVIGRKTLVYRIFHGARYYPNLLKDTLSG